MCRCCTSDCPGVRIPGHPPFWCRDNVYVFIVEPCENEASDDCIPTWRPDPRGNHDQCSNCARIQRYIYPEGVSTSTSKRKVHIPRHPAPNYAPPPYVRPPGYEDSELRVAPNSTAAAGPAQLLTHTSSNLTVVPSTPTRRPPLSGILNFPTPAPETNSRLTGLRPPMMNALTRSAGTRLTRAVDPIQAPETNSRRTGLRRPMASTATQVAEPSPGLGRTGLRASTASDTVSSTTPGPSGDLSSRPPTRRLFARPGSTDRFVPTAATRTALTGQQSRSTSPPLARFIPILYTGGANTHTHPSTANSQLGPGNSPPTPPRPVAPRTAGMFLVPPPRHETRSPPIGANLSEWDFEELAPQLNSNSDFNRGNYAIATRGGIGNSTFVVQSSIAQASQGSANDAGPSMENQRSSRWRAVREWARRTGESTGRREREQRRWQQRYFASPQGGLSRSGWQANQRDSTQWRQSLAESLRALRRLPFTWRRQITQFEPASHQAQALFGSLLDPTHTSVAPNDQPTAVVADQLTNHEPVAAEYVVRPTTPLSDRTVSEFLRRTRDHVPDLSEQHNHTSSESGSIATPSNLDTRGGSSRGREYSLGNHLSPSGGFNQSSSSGYASVHGQNGEEELVEIGNVIVRFDAGSQATDWDWNF